MSARGFHREKGESWRFRGGWVEYPEVLAEERDNCPF
jgi:hypothetical protein